MKVTRGGVSKREWTYEGQGGKQRQGSAWGFSFRLDGKQIRKQGYVSRAEAQEALDQARDAILHPAPVEATEGFAPHMTFAEACDRYLREKSRKRSIREDQRILRHLKADFGEQTPLEAITA